MKKSYIYYILLLLTLLSSISSYAQVITVADVPTTLCINESFSLTYTASGFSPNIGNEFRAEISDETGSFTTPTLIGNAFSTSLTGTLYVTIPVSLIYGTAYRIRVVATNPSVTGLDNGVDIDISCTTNDYYWIGGSGNWSDPAHWNYTVDGINFFAAVGPPSANDNANFDSNSFPSGGTLTFDQGVSINDMYWEPGSGANNPLIQSNGYSINLGGEFVLDAGVITQLYGVYFNSPKQNMEVNFGDNILANTGVGTIEFDGGGSWDLNSEITAGPIHLYNGSTFSTNDYTIRLSGQIWSNGATNTLNTGSSDIYLQDLTSNDMTITGSATWHLNGGGGFGRNVSVAKVIIESGEYLLNNNNTFDELIIMPGGGIKLFDGEIQTVVSNFEAIGTRDQLAKIGAYSPGLPGTLSINALANFTADYVSVTDNIVTGSTPYSASNAIDGGGNTGWSFSALTPLDYYWVGGTGNWSDYSAHWAKLAGGGGFWDSPPGAIDHVHFTTNSFPSGGTVTVDKTVECKTMTWEAGSGAASPKIYGDYNSALTVNGDVTFDNGVYRDIQYFYINAGPTETIGIDFADNNFSDNGYIILQGGGTLDLQSELKANNLQLLQGTFNTNDFPVTATYLSIKNDNISHWGASNVTINYYMQNDGSAYTFDPGSSHFNFIPKYSNWSIAVYGPFLFFDATFSGTTRIYGNNFFNNLTFTPGSNVELEASSTQAIAGGTLSATGLRDQPIKIESSSNGVQATISQALGTINADYVILEDNNATGGATFNASNYVDEGNVTGWSFGAALTTFDFYWVNGSGNWSDFANHWSQADGDLVNMHTFAPGPLDNVFFTANSFSGSGQVVTLNNATEINSMTWETNSGANGPSITADYNTPLTIHGDLIFSNGVQQNLYEIYFDSPNLNNSINRADNLGNANNSYLYFMGGGSWNLQNKLNAYRVEMQDATLNTMDQEIDAQVITLFSASSVLNLGNSNVYLQGFYDYSGGGATCNAGTSTFIVNGNDDYDYFDIPFPINNVQVLNNSILTIANSFLINNLTLDPGSTLTFQSGHTIGTTSINAVGTAGGPITIKSTDPGVQGQIVQTSGTVNAEYLLISDNDATGGATFNATNTIIAGDGANVTGWNITAPVSNDYYWIGGSGDWSDLSHWATADGGTTNYTTPPGIADNVFFTSQSFTGTEEKVVIDQPAFCNDMTWTTTISQSPTLFGSFDIPLKVFGSFILTDGVHRNVAELIFESYTTGNFINMADNLNGSFANMEFTGNGEWTLSSDFEAQNVDFGGGTFNTNGFTLTVDEWRFEGSDALTFNAGASEIYASNFYNYANNLTFNKGTSIVHMVQSTQNSGNSRINGPFNFNEVSIEADTRISGGNSYTTFNVSDGVTLQLASNTVQLISNLSLNGLSGSPVIVESTSNGNQGTFSVPSSGLVNADYVILKDNNATGGATFAATNSSQISNVTGWSGLLDGQVITFPDINDVVVNGVIDLAATSSSGLAVEYSVQSITGDGSITSTTFTALSVGLVAVVASQPGDGSTVGAAKNVTRYVHVNEGLLPNELGQMKQASYVVGVPNGATAGGQTINDRSLPYVTHTIVSPDGKLVAAGMGRVMIWNQLPDAFDVPADVVVGEPDFITFNPTASQTGLSFPNDIFTGSVAIGPNGELIVTDGRGVMIWNTIPTTNGAPADVIIGQTNFTSTAMAVAQDKFLSPLGVAVSTDGKLIVSDISAHRVLIFNSIPTTNGASADVVLGQPDFTSSTPGTSQTSMAFPGMVSVSPDNRLLLADITNNRVMIWNTIPTTNNAPADVVLGQPDFVSNATGLANNSFNFPMCAAVSRTGKLAVADWYNNRVLIYNQIPTDNTTGADLAIGQPDFATNGFDYENISLRTVGASFGVAWDQSENLFITDGGFDNGLNRVMVYGAKDLEPPTILNLAAWQSVYEMGASNQVSTIEVTDRSGTSDAIVYFQDVASQDYNNPAYEQVVIPNPGDDIYSFDLSAIESLSPSPLGIEYYVEVYDNLGNVVSTSDNLQVLPIYYPSGISVSGYGIGSTTEDYKIIAVPYALDNAAAEHVFQDVFGGSYDNTKMRLFTYPGGTSTSYNELNGTSTLQVGEGYFALAVTGSPTTANYPDGALTSFTTSSDVNGNIYEYAIDLVDGWNLIGNPFNHAIVWSDIEAFSGITSGEVDQLQNYSGGNYNTISSIPAGQGAFVFNNTGSNYSLRIPAKINTGGRVTEIAENDNPLTESSWEVWLKTNNAQGGEIVLGGVGMEEEAEFSKDKYDWLNPPSFSKMKQIEFSHPEFSEPSFKKDIRATNFEEKWSFTYKVDNPLHEKQELHWDNTHFGENTPDLYLVDKTHFVTINMKEESSYTFGHGGVTEFDIYFGYDAVENIMPDDFITQSPFPNPFTSEITFTLGLPMDEDYKVDIQIFDAVGRTVRYISKGDIDPGYNSIVWDGLDKEGQQIPSGIYTYNIFIKGRKGDVVKYGKVIKH